MDTKEVTNPKQDQKYLTEKERKREKERERERERERKGASEREYS